MPSGGDPLGEHQADITTALQRQEVEPVGLPFQEAAQADFEALLVALYCSTNRGVDNQSGAPALADRFDIIETQHC